MESARAALAPRPRLSALAPSFLPLFAFLASALTSLVDVILSVVLALVAASLLAFHELGGRGGRGNGGLVDGGDTRGGDAEAREWIDDRVDRRGRAAAGLIARALVPDSDLGALLAGRDFQVTARHVRLVVGAADGALVLTALAAAVALALAGPRHHASVFPRYLPFPARTFARHLDPGGTVASGDPHVAARLVRDAVGAADGFGTLAAAADVGAGARAQRQTLHVLHAHLELGAVHVLTRSAFSFRAGGYQRMRLIPGTGTNGAAPTVVLDRLPFTVVKLWAARLLTFSTLHRQSRR